MRIVVKGTPGDITTGPRMFNAHNQDPVQLRLFTDSHVCGGVESLMGLSCRMHDTFDPWRIGLPHCRTNARLTPSTGAHTIIE